MWSVPYRFIGWKTVDLHRAQVRISLRGLVFSEPFYPTWDLHSSKTKKKSWSEATQPNRWNNFKIGWDRKFKLILDLWYVAHQFVPVEFRNSNICCCFLQPVVPVEKSKQLTNIQFSKFDMKKLMSYKGHKCLTLSHAWFLRFTYSMMWKNPYLLKSVIQLFIPTFGSFSYF